MSSPAKARPAASSAISPRSVPPPSSSPPSGDEEGQARGRRPIHVVPWAHGEEGRPRYRNALWLRNSTSSGASQGERPHAGRLDHHRVLFFVSYLSDSQVNV